MLACCKFRRSFRGLARGGFAQRGVLALSLLAYLVVAIGVPLPTLRPAGNQSAKSGELYPCRDCHCGCSSAEQCWRSCCCHTLAERLAWAKNHHVTPPDYVLAAAKRAGLDGTGQPLSAKTILAVAVASTNSATSTDAASSTDSAATRSCCQQRTSSCCRQSAGERACCQSAVVTNSVKTRDVNTSDAQRLDFVVGYRALACHGQSLQWLVAVPTLIAVELNLADEFPLMAWLGPHASDSASPSSVTPTSPPPERA